LVEEAVIKTIPKKKKCKNAKCLSEETLQIAEKRREMEGEEEKGATEGEMVVWHHQFNGHEYLQLKRLLKCR